jgi:hypothetical protein
MNRVVGASDRKQAAKGGAIAGLVGGAVLVVFALIMNLATGQDIWPGMKMPGFPFIGYRATLPGFDMGPVVVGLLSHFAVSIVWGVLFGVLVYGISKGATIVAGALWGIVVWLGMFYVVLPVVGLTLVARSVPVGFAVFEHVLFGLAVALAFLPFQRTRRTGWPKVVGREPIAH